MKKYLVNFEHTLIMIIFPIMCLLILGMTISRITGIATDSFLWAEEAARYLMIWMAFLAAILASKSNSHFRMTILTRAIRSSAVRKAIKAAAAIFSVLIMVVMLYYGYHLITRQMKSGQLSPVMMIPMWIPYLAIPAGFVGMLARTVLNEVRSLRSGTAADAREEAAEVQV